MLSFFSFFLFISLRILIKQSIRVDTLISTWKHALITSIIELVVRTLRKLLKHSTLEPIAMAPQLSILLILMGVLPNR